MKQTNNRINPMYVAVLFTLLSIMGCIDTDIETPGTGNGKPVSVEATIPSFELPATRSIEEGKGESTVHAIDMLVFGKSEGTSSSPNLLQRCTGTNITQELVGNEYKVSFNADLKQADDAGSVIIVANATASVDRAIKAASDKLNIVKLLTFSTTADNEGRYNWDVDGSTYTPIPMYGEKIVDKVTTGEHIPDIELIKMVARIDVENQLDANVFKLDSIYLVNYRTDGFIAPAWNIDNGNMLAATDPDYPYTNNIDPITPSTVKPGNDEATAMKYDYPQKDNEVGPLMAGQIYTYEALKAYGKNDDPTKRICLILKGLYKGTTYYYRVDFTHDTNDANDSIRYKQGDNMPIYRNHKYIVSVTKAEGIGYKTYNEALNSTTVISNLKTSILVVDMSDVNEIVFNGQYFMGVESRTLEIPLVLNNKTFTHKITSNYHGAWQASLIDGAGLDLLTTSGSDINKDEIKFTVNKLDNPAVARIEFVAGRLRDTLTIRRVSMADLFARSNVVVQGSGSSAILTFATTVEENSSLPASMQGVFFKWGSLVALTPAGNPYDPGNHVIYNPTNEIPATWGNSMAGYDKVPYAHSNFQFTEPSTSTDDTDAFKEYGNGTGFIESKGTGDICRYITSKGSWVSTGKWRMPTYEEWQLLLDEAVAKSKYQNFENFTEYANNNAEKYYSGIKFLAQGGWFLSLQTTNLNPENADVPPAMTVFLPTSGQRYPNGNGDVVHIGAYGYYWSSTPIDTYTANYLFMDKSEVGVYEADRSYAFPIRCIKDY